MESTSSFPPEPHRFRQQMGLPVRPRVARREPAAEGDSDMKLFVVSFTAFFICFYTFLF